MSNFQNNTGATPEPCYSPGEMQSNASAIVSDNPDPVRKNIPGTVIHVSKDGRYGFIRYNETESIYYSKKNSIDNLIKGDHVIFSIRPSKMYAEKLEGRYISKIHTNGGAASFFLSGHMRLKSDAKTALRAIIKEISLSEDDLAKKEIIKEFKLDGITGKSYACATSLEDDVFYAKRQNRRGFSRFVKDRQPEVTNLFTVILRRKKLYYEIVAAYFGPYAPAEPWDRVAKIDSLEFWRTHALIPQAIFMIDYSSVREFDPDFFKSFEEIQQSSLASNEEIEH